MKPKVAIIGKGSVGSALGRGLARAAYEIKTTGRDPKTVRATGTWGDVVILAVPYGALEAAVAALGDSIRGKTVVDVSNALTKDMKLALGFNTSGAEELQKRARDAKVVKAFNTVFAKHMDTGRVNDQQISTFIAGDDNAARQQVLALARDIGFDAVDSGPLQNARWIEALGYFTVQLGYVQKLGPDIGFKLVR